MNGLLMRDILIIKKSYHGLLGIATVILLVGVFFIFPQYAAIYIPLLLPTFTVIVSAELVVSDEKSGWKKYLPALPLTHREIILSRYAFCGLFIAATVFISLIYSFLSILFFGNWMYSEVLTYSLGGLLFALLMLIVGIPVGYFFKGQVATSSMMGVIILVMVLRDTGIIAFLLSINYWIMVIIAAIVLFALLYVSYRLSLLIYTERIRLSSKEKRASKW